MPNRNGVRAGLSRLGSPLAAILGYTPPVSMPYRVIPVFPRTRNKMIGIYADIPGKLSPEHAFPHHFSSRRGNMTSHATLCWFSGPHFRDWSAGSPARFRPVRGTSHA